MKRLATLATQPIKHTRNGIGVGLSIPSEGAPRNPHRTPVPFVDPVGLLSLAKNNVFLEYPRKRFYHRQLGSCRRFPSTRPIFAPAASSHRRARLFPTIFDIFRSALMTRFRFFYFSPSGLFIDPISAVESQVHVDVSFDVVTLFGIFFLHAKTHKAARAKRPIILPEPPLRPPKLKILEFRGKPHKEKEALKRTQDTFDCEK